MRQAGRGVTLAAIVLAGALGAGCASQARVENPMRLAGVAPAEAETVAMEVLRTLRFEPIVPGAAPGRIETRPLTAASWFEFWREDTIGCDQRLEASLHTIRRTVLVTVSPAGDGSEVSVAVDRRRLAEGYGAYGASVPYDLYQSDIDIGQQGGAPAIPHPDLWSEAGRDERLEQRILDRIRTRAGPAL